MTEKAMKQYLRLRITIAGIAMAAISLALSLPGFPADKEVYQLRIYTLGEQRQAEVMDGYLRNAFIPALHRTGIERVGVFKLIDPADSLLVVLIPFNSMGHFGNLEDILINDPKYLKEAEVFLGAPHDRPPYDRMESILLEAFDEMPEMAVPEHSTPRRDRVYELRSYEGPTETYYRRKVEMFNEGGEVAIFQKLGFQPVFFGTVISGASMPNLMYMTTFKDAGSQEKLWKTFRGHPDWAAIKDLEKYRNTVSHIDRTLFYPADYSDF